MKNLISTVAILAALCTGCAGKVYVFHLGTESVGFSGNGGVQWILPDGGPRYIPEHSTVPLPVRSGNLTVAYESATPPGVYVTYVDWVVDGHSIGSSESQRGITIIRNMGDGTHSVDGVVYRRYAGDRRSAPTDTLSFWVKTFYPNFDAGVRWVHPDGTSQIFPGSTINLPTSRGHLPLVFQVGEAMAEGRFCSYVDYYVDGQLQQRSEPPFSFTFRNTGNGDHEVRCIAYFLRTQDRQPDGVVETLFKVRTWKDVY
jgi:hypothetical protein